MRMLLSLRRGASRRLAARAVRKTARRAPPRRQRIQARRAAPAAGPMPRAPPGNRRPRAAAAPSTAPACASASQSRERRSGRAHRRGCRRPGQHRRSPSPITSVAAKRGPPGRGAAPPPPPRRGDGPPARRGRSRWRRRGPRPSETRSARNAPSACRRPRRARRLGAGRGDHLQHRGLFLEQGRDQPVARRVHQRRGGQHHHGGIARMPPRGQVEQRGRAASPCGTYGRPRHVEQP